VTFLTVFFTRGARWQVLSFVTLFALAMWAYHFPKIGVTFMPPLNEGTTLDMPVTVPRASVTQAADDLKARDALLRGFPEVESVIGKAGRADTPTDPAPLDMVETFVNFRPKELWPKRVLRYSDAAEQTRQALETLVSQGFIERPEVILARRQFVDKEVEPMKTFTDWTRRLPAVGPWIEARGGVQFLERVASGYRERLESLIKNGKVVVPEDRRLRDDMIVDASQKAMERFDETMRSLALSLYEAAQTE